MADLPIPPPADPAMPAPNQLTAQVPAAPQIVQQPVLNWSHFRPEITDRSEEDVEAHLLCTNDWINTHNFPGDVQVQRFCFNIGRRG